jgi:hypothetical protein
MRGPESEGMMNGTSTGGQASMLSKESIKPLTHQMLIGKNARMRTCPITGINAPPVLSYLQHTPTSSP